MMQNQHSSPQNSTEFSQISAAVREELRVRLAPAQAGAAGSENDPFEQPKPARDALQFQRKMLAQFKSEWLHGHQQ